MTFSLGVKRWHVVGYRHTQRGFVPDKHLCGQGAPGLWGWGSGYDVAQADIPLCKTCDRVTGGQALGEVVSYA